jgi:hypothetical protein
MLMAFKRLCKDIAMYYKHHSWYVSGTHTA